jgi:hypothetical protein
VKQNKFSDQRGVAMIFELVLIAAVITLAGLAVYQNSQRSKVVSDKTSQAPTTAFGIAASAAATAEQESVSDLSLTAEADASADELTATDEDVTSLGDTANASF